MPALERLQLDFDPNTRCGDEELDSLDPDAQEDEEGSWVRYPFFWYPNPEQFPRLTHLTLGPCVSFSLRFPAITTLTSLELECCVTSTIPLNHFMERFLTKFPALQELRLCRVDISPSPGSALSFIPSLCRLRLEHFPLQVASFLSSLAPLPVGMNVHLNRRPRYIGPDLDPESPITALYSLPTDRSVLPVLDLVETVTIHQDWFENYSLFGTTPTGTTVEIAAWVAEDCPEPLDYLADVADAFKNAPVTELRVDGHDKHKMDEEQWAHVLLTFPHLRRVAIVDTREGECDARPGLLKALRSVPSGSSEVLCAELQSLTLVAQRPRHDAEFAAEIVECLAERSVRGRRLQDLCMILVHPKKTGKKSPTFQERQMVYTKTLKTLVGTLRFEEHKPPVHCEYNT
uniref:Two-component-like hybrid sensor histidine kinase 1 n=1 Tax=Ganoderma boninense TaxID=34458 RepID=A0A5K1JU45_9APHY|nr:Two-component-like hybrid sensor histidine kinase 1 [Ganoderma boninense]